MDIFVEQLVKRPGSGKTTAIKALIGVGAALICLISVYLMLLGFAIALFIAIGACYGAYFLMSNLDVEYEYIVTNGEVDIDKIVAQRTRKRLLTAKASSFERFGKLSEAPALESGATTVQADGVGANVTETYYADLTHPSLGNVRLIFSPEEKVIEALKPYFSRNLRFDIDHKFGR